jgi:ribonuclease P/MRP protein subunit POP5
MFGDEGIARVNPSVIDSGGPYCTVRCRRGEERSLEAALASVYRIGDVPIALRTLATSGTIQSLRERIPPPAEESWGEAVFGGTVYTARFGSRQKVDLFEKGIKSQKVLFLIQHDIEGI